jgi:ADP-heptose:LPS heptosyltransferase
MKIFCIKNLFVKLCMVRLFAVSVSCWATDSDTALSRTDIGALFAQGIEELRAGNIEQALDAYRTILAHFPNQTQSLYNYGYILKTIGRVDEAIDIYKKVLALDPTYEAARFALGHAYLHNGNYEQGWAIHQRHIRSEKKASDNFWDLVKNNELRGKTILLLPEGGLGDTINFIRYAQKIHDSGARVICLVQKPLYPLISRCPYIDLLVTDPTTIPPYDAKASYMSLPALFNSNEQTIPKNIPYIFPDPDLVQHWKQKLATDHTFKIGISWQADVFNDSSRLPIAHRGIPLEKLYPLGLIQGIHLYSLQKKDGLEQLKNIPASCKITCFESDFDEKNGNFMDSAAVISQLDLIITVDSALAHLAGALGKPVWMLHPFAVDWRWIAHRTDSPWYPTMRIFKQPKPFDWESVAHEVLYELINTVNTSSIARCGS